MTLKQHFIYSVAQVADHQLVERGLYKVIRHPDYVGQDLGQTLYFGIDSMDRAVKSQIDALSDKIVHLYGTLLSNVPDYNGSQIQVDRVEVEE